MQQWEKEGFEAHGFLAPELTGLVSRVRAANAEWFDLAGEISDALNAACFRNMDSAAKDQPSGTAKPIAHCVLLRATADLQASVLLAERGMVVQARSMARNVTEDAFCLASLMRDPDAFIRHLADDHAASRKGHAKAILKFGNPDAYSREEVNRVLESIPRQQNLGPADLADLGKLGSLYLAYKVLSNDSSHPSATSLRRYIGISEDGQTWTGFRVGPASDEEVTETLNFVILAGLTVGVGYTEFSQDEVGNETFALLSERYRALPPLSSR